MKRNREIIQGIDTNPVGYDMVIFEKYGYEFSLDEMYHMSYEESDREDNHLYSINCLNYCKHNIFYRESDVDKINDEISSFMLWEDYDYYHESYQEWNNELSLSR